MRIIIKYKMPNWSQWNTVTCYDADEADRWVFGLKREGFEVERY